MPNAFHTRPGPLRHSWRQGQTLFADYGSPLLAITVLASDLVRIRLAPAGSFAPRRSWAVTPPDDQFISPTFTIDQVADASVLATEHLMVEVAHDGGRVRICERNGGRTVLADGPEGGPAWDAATGAASWVKQMPSDEHYYGFGERTGLLDKRGRRSTCWTTDEYEHQGPSTDALYLAIPFFLALNAIGCSYGLFLNTTY